MKCILENCYRKIACNHSSIAEYCSIHKDFILEIIKTKKIPPNKRSEVIQFAKLLDLSIEIVDKSTKTIMDL